MLSLSLSLSLARALCLVLCVCVCVHVCVRVPVCYSRDTKKSPSCKVRLRLIDSHCIRFESFPSSNKQRTHGQFEGES